MFCRFCIYLIGYLDEWVPSFQEWDTSIRLAKICKFVQMDALTFFYCRHSGDAISKNEKLIFDGYDYIIWKFESEIKQKCGLKIWERHLLNQYNSAVQFGFKQKRDYYFNQLSLRTKISLWWRKI